MTTPQLGAISIDCSEPSTLAAFYRELLDLTTLFENDHFIALGGAATALTFHQVTDHRPPDWPTGPTPKQFHLDFAVADLDAAEQRAVALGAHKAEFQPSPDRWRVLIDPAGHPFCVTVLIPLQ